jgi:hypothetical protein
MVAYSEVVLGPDLPWDGFPTPGASRCRDLIHYPDATPLADVALLIF